MEDEIVASENYEHLNSPTAFQALRLKYDYENHPN